MTLRIASGGLLLTLAAPSAMAQPASQAPVLRLFLDVQQAFVDQAFLRTEIPWVDWVRDPKDAEVHLILTTKRNGGGGATYVLRFLGRDPFTGVDDEFTVPTASTDTADTIRRALADRLALGLARYLARRPGPQPMALVRREATAPPPPSPAKDPWDAWVYRMGVNGFFNGESQTSSSSTSATLSASRITENELFRASASGNWNASRYQLSDQVLRTRTEAYNANLTWAHGLSDHWTWGVLGSAERSTQSNLASALRVAPALEYNVWKYAQANQKQFTFLYQIGAGRTRYTETTLYGKNRETLYDNSLALTLSLNQPWGTVSTSLTGSAYLHDWSKNSLALSNNMSLRLGRGFSLNLFGFYSRVRNQLNLSSLGATDEEVLLRLRQLQTSYTYFGSIGISYTFGSIFNNAVNTRFGSAGGGGGTTFFFGN